MSLYHSIKAIYPDIQDYEYSLQDDSDGKGPYISRWVSTQYPQPTQEQLDAAQAKADYLQAYTITASKRQIDYPSLGDQVGAIVKQISSLKTAGAYLIPEMCEIVDKVQAIKDANPKPEEVK